MQGSLSGADRDSCHHCGIENGVAPEGTVYGPRGVKRGKISIFEQGQRGTLSFANAGGLITWGRAHPEQIETAVTTVALKMVWHLRELCVVPGV